MSLSAWVQLFRNLFCVLKSLVPSSHFLQHPLIPNSSFYPFSITTFLEFLIAPTQFAAVIFNGMAGFKRILKALNQWNVTNLWIPKLDYIFCSGTLGSEYCIMRQGLEVDRFSAVNDIIVGIFEMIFGFAFLFLTFNSLHIVGPTHPKPLVDALISMEIGLAYILVLMWNAYLDRSKDASRLNRFVDAMKVMKAITPTGVIFTKASDAGFIGMNGELMRVVTYLDSSYIPKWRRITSEEAIEIENKPDVVTSLINKELETLKTIANNFAKYDDSLLSQHRIKVLDDIEIAAEESKILSFLDMIYFILNFVAGYGYLLGILAFYSPSSDNNLIVKMMMLGMSHDNADWWGNLAGDMAWTIEPAIILYQKQIVDYYLSCNNKNKQETKSETESTKLKVQ